MNSTKRLLVSTLLASLFSTAALAATPGFDPETGRIILPSEVALEEEDYESTKQDMAAIQAAEAQYKALQEAAEETSRIQLWEKLDSEIKLRRYDKLVFDMRKNFDDAKAATNPFIGEQGYVIYPYGEVIPIITCRPMRMTDIALEPGESIMGIHAGDTVRWTFDPSQSMKNGLAVSHIIVKPSQPGISTNLIINTDKRSYNLDFTATESEQYVRGAAFSYQTNDLTAIFRKSLYGDNPKKALEDELQGVNGVDLDGLYTRYTIIDKNRVDWRPDAVFDDGNKTYIRMPLRFSETPAFYILLDKKETLSNYRVKGRYFIVDRLFDRAYLKIGTKRVAIVREDKLTDSNIKESKARAERRKGK
ncbi:MAG: TrbG/VirB9 family P-type conjugative transfer protein [Synergistaceae bacterium]|nr:TrbG/VirB9 family P-type conjugative transfer protein [Synergistaceae bacterium]